MPFYQLRKQRTILRPFYLHNEISYPGKMTSLTMVRHKTTPNIKVHGDNMGPTWVRPHISLMNSLSGTVTRLLAHGDEKYYTIHQPRRLISSLPLECIFDRVECIFDRDVLDDPSGKPCGVAFFLRSDGQQSDLQALRTFGERRQ